MLNQTMAVDERYMGQVCSWSLGSGPCISGKLYFTNERREEQRIPKHLKASMQRVAANSAPQRAVDQEAQAFASASSSSSSHPQSVPVMPTEHVQ